MYSKGDILLIKNLSDENGLTVSVVGTEDNVIKVKPVDSEKWFPSLPFIQDFTFDVDIGKSRITLIQRLN